jgi:hypothetical protein
MERKSKTTHEIVTSRQERKSKKTHYLIEAGHDCGRNVRDV